MDNATTDTVNLNHPKSLQPWLTGVGVLLVVLLMAALLYWRVYLPRTCTVHAVQEASSFLNSQRTTFDHEYQFATTVPPESIKIPMATLQQILLDTDFVSVPRCVQPAKDQLLQYMTIVLQAFEAYRTRAGDATVAALVNQSNTHYDQFVARLESVNRCAPYCLPFVK